MSSTLNLADTEATGPLVVIDEGAGLAYEFHDDHAVEAWAAHGKDAFTRVRAATQAELAAAASGQEALVAG